MKRSEVSVSARVMEGLEAVRLSGRTNMLDIATVMDLASRMGYWEAEEWICEHKELYARGVFSGFGSTVILGESGCEHEKDGRAERGHGKCADK